jgi:hypothetical protein
MTMSFSMQDLQWTTYDIGRFKSGTVTHLPTGNFVHWTTDREHPSVWRAREAAQEELQKLVDGLKQISNIRP